jgi:isopenicillin N synthase-like dioxygenase
LGNAFHNVGFVGVINHGIQKPWWTSFTAMQSFCLPVDVKRSYEVSGLAGQRGYTSFGKEHAKQSTVGDLKVFQIGQTVTDADAIKSEYPDNVVVKEMTNFTDKGNELYKAFEKSGSQLLAAIGEFLGLGNQYFRP